MKNEIITKRKKRIAIIFLCLIFIIQAFPIVGCTSDNTDAGVGSGTSEPEFALTTDTEDENRTIESDNSTTEDITSDITDAKTVADTTAESTELDSDSILDYFKNSTILSFPSDMRAEEIYNEVLKGGWVIDDLGDSDFTAGGDLWQEFCEKSNRLEPCSVLLAYYYKNSSGGEDYVKLIEIKFDGELYYYARFCSQTDTIEDTGTYKYLMKDFYEIYEGPVIGQGLVKAFFLSNDDTWTYREWSHIQL